MIYLWAFVLFLVNSLAWFGNLFSLPGNWLMLLAAVIYTLLLPADAHPRLDTTVLIICVVIAIAGEIWEFVAGAAGAKKHGGSRKGAALAIAASIVGSIIGATVGVPVPIFGPVIGAIGGGALGAFIGAYLGDHDRPHEIRMAIGKGAFVGRLMGTMGKLACGLVILALLTLDSLIDLAR